MDWALAIGRQTEALARILAALLAMAAGDAQTLPRHLHRAVLRVLRPAEAAARRLVIALAHTLPPPPPRFARPASHASQRRIGVAAARTPAILPRSPGTAEGGGVGASAPRKPAALPLFDCLRLPATRRRARSGVPRISVPGYGTPAAIAGPPLPDDPVDAGRLHLRLRALAAALDDLPAAARRFARWRARLARPGRPRKPVRVWPLKPGRPPGWRKRPAHEIHDVLRETHWLALTALERRDSS